MQIEQLILSFFVEHPLKCATNSSKTVSSLSVVVYQLMTHQFTCLLYRNTLDFHCKHTASHLHVEVRTWLVFSDIDSRYSMTSLHYHFQSLPQMNCLHIHTITNISAWVNNHTQTVIAVHRYNTWISDWHVEMYAIKPLMNSAGSKNKT